MARPEASSKKLGEATKTVITSNIERAWLSGLILGEGSITTHFDPSRNRTRATIEIKMTEKAIMQKAASILGVSVIGPFYDKRGAGYRPRYEVSVLGTRAVNVLQEILPYLVGVRKERAEVILRRFPRNGTLVGRITASEIFT